MTDRIAATMVGPSLTTVALGRFPDLLARGLQGLVEDDPALMLRVRDVDVNAVEAFERPPQPDVLILDAGALASPSLLRELATRHPGIRLVVLADAPFGVEAAQLLAFGADACLSKDAELRDLLNAIHLAVRGLQVMPRESDALDRAGLLTPREREVLGHLQGQASNAEIAADLHVGVETVRTHVRNIYRKLGVGSRRELLARPPRRARSGAAAR